LPTHVNASWPFRFSVTFECHQAAAAAETSLTIFIATKVRIRLTPAVNALGLVLMIITLPGAITWEIARRRQVSCPR
jgi:hypothetical protein